MTPQKLHLLTYWEQYRIITDHRVLEAFQKIDREHFIGPEYLSQAYSDYPLPIGSDQTISQPTTVMIMTQALKCQEGSTVLEVGTGSGYQAALLSILVGPKGKVYTTETVKELYHFSKKNLTPFTNVKVIDVDGSLGLPKLSPFDRIIVTCAAPAIPPPLVDQLRVGGILIIPVGVGVQTMIRLTKIAKKVMTEKLGDFTFVPLKGKWGQS